MGWRIVKTKINVVREKPVSPYDKVKLHFNILLEKESENPDFPQACDYITVTVKVTHEDFAYRINDEILETNPVFLQVVEEPYIILYSTVLPAIIFLPELEEFKNILEKSERFKREIEEFEHFKQKLPHILDKDNETANKVINTITEVFKNYSRKLKFFNILR
ncbi:MAG: hypothetical protein J7K83_04030 [Candidatus Aenigmarchaeota archaeon]|nr:hypothetical protein [Candidatus Aenigmarchaeota archaeon]